MIANYACDRTKPKLKQNEKKTPTSNSIQPTSADFESFVVQAARDIHQHNLNCSNLRWRSFARTHIFTNIIIIATLWRFFFFVQCKIIFSAASSQKSRGAQWQRGRRRRVWAEFLRWISRIDLTRRPMADLAVGGIKMCSDDGWWSRTFWRTFPLCCLLLGGVVWGGGTLFDDYSRWSWFSQLFTLWLTGRGLFGRDAANTWPIVITR